MVEGGASRVASKRCMDFKRTSPSFGETSTMFNKTPKLGSNQIGQFKNKIKYHKYIIGVYRAKTIAMAAQELSIHKEALSTSLHQQEIFWKQRAKNH